MIGRNSPFRIAEANQGYLVYLLARPIGQTRRVTCTLSGLPPLRHSRCGPTWDPDVPFVGPNLYKDQFGPRAAAVLLVFGMLSPNKCIENAVSALPHI